MKRNLRRLLATLLCGAMLLGLLPALTAFAAEEYEVYTPNRPQAPEYVEESTTVTRDIRDFTTDENGIVYYTDSTVTETYTRHVLMESAPDAMSVEKQEENFYTFTEFADLKALSSVAYANYTELLYTGEGPLVISENLVLPANLQLYFTEDNSHLIIAEGVSFETSTHSNNMSVKVLEVKGSFTSRAHVYVEESLSVSGELILYQDIAISYGAPITGRENIKKGTDYATISLEAEVKTQEELLKLVAEASVSDMDYSVFMNLEEDFTLTESVHIPANMFFSLWSDQENIPTFTIAPGVTLEYNQYESISINMVVEGTLKINEELYFHGDSITFTETGRLAGRGYLFVESRGTFESYEDIVKGLNPANTYVEEEVWGDGYKTWKILDITGKTKLSAPKNLLWNKDIVWEWDDEAHESIQTLIDRPGSALWERGDIMQNQFYLQYYRLNADGTSSLMGSVNYHVGSGDPDSYYALDHFKMYDPETGDYYFTVRAMADGENYVNSDVAKSGIWHYVKPEAQLPQITRPTWNWPQGSWTIPADMEDHTSLEVEVLFAATPYEEPYLCASSWGWHGEGYFEVWENVIHHNGLGYYFFRVRLISDDITQTANAKWSPMSPGYNLTHLSDEMADTLDSILNATSGKTDEEIRKSVQDLDTESLKQSMLADKGASGVIDALVELEEAVGGPAAVSVSEEASAFDASKVSIVGANLNNAANEANDITLVIDKPEKEHVMDTLYDNAVAVSFSMTLDNVEDTKNLEVPVLITLPIPADINRNFLVILHYAQDGSIHELIHPHVFREGAQWYASFPLTSFSDFVMTQKLEHEHEPAILPAVAPTCLEYGLTEGSVCALCDAILVPQEQLAPLGHMYTDFGDASCNVCGALRVVDLERPTMSMYRLYNPNSGEHFYTGSVEERDTLIGYGWEYEGVGFTFPYSTGKPVHRLYDRYNTMEHMYTMDETEMQLLLAAGWEYEGVAFNSGYESEVPQYRLHNPNATIGAYHFTASVEEKDALIAAGWEYQGIGFYSCWQ